MKLAWLEKDATDLNSVREPVKEAPAEKMLDALHVLANDLEGTPLVPQLILTKPVEAVLEIEKELPSKEREVTLARVPLIEPISMPGRLPELPV